MPRINPFEETMRAGQMNVPQRARRINPDIGFDRAGPVRETSRGANIGFDRAGPAGPPSNIGRARAGGFGWNDMRQLMDERMPTMDSGEYLASRFGGGIDDAAGMNEQQTALNIGDTFSLEGLGRTRPYGGTLDMGPQYEELETIPLDLQFDQWGYPIGQDDWGYGFGAARGGIMSLRR